MRTWSMKLAPHTAVEPQFYPPHWKKPRREADGTPSSVQRGLGGGGLRWEETLSSPALGSVGSKGPEHSRAGVGAWMLLHRWPGQGGHSLVVVVLHELLELFNVAHGLQVLLHVGQGGEVVCRRRRPRGFSLSPSLSLPVSGPHLRRD